MNSKPEEQFTDWENIDWGAVIPRVLLYAARRVRHLKIGIDPEDLVSIAYDKAISGQRKWYPDRCKLHHFLIGIVSSEITNLAKKEFNKNHIPVEFIESSNESIYLQNISIDKYDQEKIISRSQERKRLNEFLMEQDILLKKIADLILDLGISQPRELSDELEISIEEVNNAKKRLRRALKKFLSNSSQPEKQEVSTHAS